MAKSDRILLVEGLDDQHSVIHFAIRRGADWEHPNRPLVEQCGGYTRLRERASPTLLKSAVRCGIILDANGDPGARWRSIRDRLLESGAPSVPDTPKAGGWIGPGRLDHSQLGVWMMPDNREIGMLEDFLSFLVPATDAIWSHARTATQEAIAAGAPLATKDSVKGTLHAWLAWQHDPGLPFGAALKARVLNADGPLADQFFQSLTELFGLPIKP